MSADKSKPESRFVKWTISSEKAKNKINLFSEVPSVSTHGRKNMGKIDSGDVRMAWRALMDNAVYPGDLIVENGRYYIYSNHHNSFKQ